MYRKNGYLAREMCRHMSVVEIYGKHVAKYTKWGCRFLCDKHTNGHELLFLFETRCGILSCETNRLKRRFPAGSQKAVCASLPQSGTQSLYMFGCPALSQNRPLLTRQPNPLFFHLFLCDDFIQNRHRGFRLRLLRKSAGLNPGNTYGKKGGRAVGCINRANVVQ